MQIEDAALALSILNQYDVVDDGTIEVYDGATLILSFDLPADAMGAASGTGGPGTRSIEFLGEPYSATAVASSVDNATELSARIKDSGGTVMMTLLVTTAADGSGEMQISGTSGHSGNPSKPQIVSGNSVSVSVAAITV